MSGTSKRSKIWLSGTPKRSKIWLLGTPKWSKISILKNFQIHFLGLFFNQTYFLNIFFIITLLRHIYGKSFKIYDTPPLSCIRIVLWSTGLARLVYVYFVYCEPARHKCRGTSFWTADFTASLYLLMANPSKLKINKV